MQINTVYSTPPLRSVVQTKERQTQNSYTPAPAAQPTQASSTAAIEQQPPVQAYALPAWMAQVGVSLNTLGSNAMSSKDRALMAADPQDRADLGEKWSQHARHVFENNGLSDLMTRYEATRASPELNKDLHRQFNESVKGDASLLALMDKMGIDLLPVD